MYWLIEIGVINALTAALLAAGVLLISRWIKRPAVIHALWVVVLLKLVTPPIVEIPLGLRLERPAAWSQTEDGDERGHTPIATVLSESAWRVEEAIAIPRKPLAELSGPAADGPMRQHEAATSAPATLPRTTPDPQVELARDAPAAATVAEIPSTPRASRWFSASALRACLAYLMPMVLWTWLAGIVVWFAVQGTRIVRFQRLLRAVAVPGDDGLQQQTRQLAAALGIRRSPRVWVVPATMSPMLWAIGSRAQLLFPQDLLRRVDSDGRATLLTHELAHYHRCDHWVRLLELVVTGLYWWHPVVWLARREIEVAEEHCCDAWVVGQLSGPRCYAEALLDTIDFLSETPRCVPPAASGLGHVPFLRKRLTMIMRGVAPKSMSGATRLAVLSVATILLPLGPQLFGAAIQRADAALSSLRVAELIPDPELVPDEASPDPEDHTVEETTVIPASSASLTPEELPPAPLEEIKVWARAVSPNGRFLVTAKTDGSVSLRDQGTARTHDLTAYRITSVDFSPEGSLLAAGSSDAAIYLFDTTTGRLLDTLPGHAAAVRSVAFGPRGKQLVSGSADGAVKVFDLNTHEEIAAIAAQPSAVNCVRFSPGGRLLAIGSGSWMSGDGGRVAIWDLPTSKQTRTLPTTMPVGALTFASENKLIVAGWSGLIQQWNLAAPTTPSVVRVDKDVVSTAAFAPGNEAVLIDAANRAVLLAR